MNCLKNERSEDIDCVSECMDPITLFSEQRILPNLIALFGTETIGVCFFVCKKWKKKFERQPLVKSCLRRGTKQTGGVDLLTLICVKGRLQLAKRLVLNRPFKDVQNGCVEIVNTWSKCTVRKMFKTLMWTRAVGANWDDFLKRLSRRHGARSGGLKEMLRHRGLFGNNFSCGRCHKQISFSNKECFCPDHSWVPCTELYCTACITICSECAKWVCVGCIQQICSVCGKKRCFTCCRGDLVKWTMYGYFGDVNCFICLDCDTTATKLS